MSQGVRVRVRLPTEGDVAHVVRMLERQFKATTNPAERAADHDIALRVLSLVRIGREMVPLLRRIVALYRPISCGWEIAHEACTEFDSLERELAVKTYELLNQVEPEVEP